MAQQPEITADLIVGDMPGGNNVPPTAGRVETVRSLAAIEYVAGRKYDWYTSMPRGLPWAIDDVSNDFGADIYDRMLLDPQCRSVTDVYKAAVLETGLNLRPAVDRKTDDGYQQARDLTDEIERMLDDMESDLYAVLWNLLDAVGLGYKAAEQVFQLDATPSGKRRYVLSHLDVKPRESLAFVVDPYLHVLGMLSRIPGQALTAQQAVIVWDPALQPNFLPRAKFAVFTHRPNNNDPRGTSLLRPAFGPWQMKQQLQREWVKYLTQFASPSLIGYTADGAMPYARLDENGEPLLDPVTGEPDMIQPEAAMVQALEQFANGTASAFPFGSQVQVIAMSGEGEAFVTAHQHYDRQIAKAILGQTLATEEGQHQSRSSSGTHKDILDMLVLHGKRPLQRMIRKDVLSTWLRLNGQESLIPLLPKVTLGSIEREDQSRMIGAVAALFASGYISRSQMPDIDEMLGLTPRDPDEDAAIPVTEEIQVRENVDGGDPPPNVKKPKVPKPVQQATAADLSPHGQGKGTGA